MKEFIKLTLPFEENLFDPLCQSTRFEILGSGRMGNHLVNPEGENIPIVRTTTEYSIPAQVFSDIHLAIIEKLKEEIQNNGGLELPLIAFNHALIEVYEKSYFKMNFHSDQALDLEDDAYIGLFSCYEHPNLLTEKNLRKLIVQEKGNAEVFEIPLTPHSMVLFSVKTNRKFQHKIILDSNQVNAQTDNKWLGITFRKSKTWLRFQDNLACFVDGESLVLADEEQKKEFFKLRGQENRAVDFNYPNLTYTISKSDLLKPVQ